MIWFYSIMAFISSILFIYNTKKNNQTAGLLAAISAGMFLALFYTEYSLNQQKIEQSSTQIQCDK